MRSSFPFSQERTLSTIKSGKRCRRKERSGVSPEGASVGMQVTLDDLCGLFHRGHIGQLVRVDGDIEFIFQFGQELQGPHGVVLGHLREGLGVRDGSGLHIKHSPDHFLDLRLDLYRIHIHFSYFSILTKDIFLSGFENTATTPQEKGEARKAFRDSKPPSPTSRTVGAGKARGSPGGKPLLKGVSSGQPSHSTPSHNLSN